MTIWIGEIQWMIRHGLGYRRDPILKSLHHIETRDALLDLTDPSKPREAQWPEAEFIVGNPPFLGAKLLRRGLGNGTVEALYFRCLAIDIGAGGLLVVLAREGSSADHCRSDKASSSQLSPFAEVPIGARSQACRPVRWDLLCALQMKWILSGATVTSASLVRTTEPRRELDGQRVTRSTRTRRLASI